MAECARTWCDTVTREQFKKDHGEYPYVESKQIEQESQQLWNSFKKEFRLLVCTKDKKYKDVRAQIAKLAGQKGQLAVMSAVASSIAVYVGVLASTVLTPLCAICFLAGSKIGREILCKRLSPAGFKAIGVELGHREKPRS
jgi:hypothetical protein